MTLERIDEIIKNDAPIGNIEKLLASYYREQKKAEWLAERKAEYDKLYPAMRDMTAAEKTAHDTVDGTVIEREEGYVYPQVPIDYTDDSSYVSYDNWLNETKVVKEAVLDDEGNIVKPEETELVRLYTEPSDELISGLVETYQPLQDRLVEKAKKQKEIELAELTVKTNTVLYDANRKALSSMSGVVNIANWRFNQAIANGTDVADAYKAIYKDTTIGWRGADNVTHNVKIESVCEALENSMKAVAHVIGV